jgi:hypothetical protein
MDSERQKREKEIARLLQQTEVNRETDVAFQEEIRRTAAAILEKETGRIQKSEPVKVAKRALTPLTAGLWLLVFAAAAFVLSMPEAGVTLLVCAIAAIVWATLLKQSKK